MSQMKPYCFKCGAELEPDAIYCPECGRLQRSMVVRAVEPGQGAPPAPPPGKREEQPISFYPNRDAQPAQPAEYQPDQSTYYPEAAPQHPDQRDPYAEQQYPDQGWYRPEETAAHAVPDQQPAQ